MSPVEMRFWGPGRGKRTGFCRKKESGFTLIEILVAVLILSVGFLGLAGLQNKGLRENKSALFRSRAVQACEDILDRMRVNRDTALDGDYEIDDLNEDTSLDISYTQMVRTDLTQWKNTQIASLPEGEGSIDIVGEVVTIVLSWSEASETQTVTVKTRL